MKNNKRFQLVQRYEEFTDYNTALGSAEDGLPQHETIRRLTIVDGGQSYLTMRDYSTKPVSAAEITKLLAEEE